jgi:hypothetical protein
MVGWLDGLGGRWELRVLVLDRKPGRKLIYALVPRVKTQ